MNTKPITAAIIVAGGSGTRAGTTAPKQFVPIAGKPLMMHAIETFLTSNAIDFVVPVLAKEALEEFASMRPDHTKLLATTIGGATRQGSVFEGLQALTSQKPDYVLIHDAARPNVKPKLIERVIEGLSEADAVLPATQVIDTIKRSIDGRTIGGTEDRTQLFAAQTPQGFAYQPIFAAHKRARELTDGFTDDAAIAEWAKLEVVLCPGDPDNIKVTLPGDFARAAALIEPHADRDMMETRTGSAMDIHQFALGDSVILGGVSIPHTHKLKGHSDADAALHVLTDALLGALADGDIGTHFPPTDPKWKGEPSRTFLEYAVSKVLERNGRIVHLDLTINAEEPKISPHTQSIRQSISDIAGIEIGRISVKATTAEKMGFVGRKEGILTLATATIEIPRSPK